MASLPILGLVATILTLNVVAPSSSDVRVVNYVVQAVSRVGGRVIDVPVEANRPVKKGGVLFRIDPMPYRQELAALEARVPELTAKLDSARAYQRELNEQLKSARFARQPWLRGLCWPSGVSARPANWRRPVQVPGRIA